MDNSSTYAYAVSKDNVKEETFAANGYSWTKQKVGKAIGNAIGNIEELRQEMASLMNSKKYDWMNHNCHIAQEVTRYRYGWADLEDLSYKHIVGNMIA